MNGRRPGARQLPRRLVHRGRPLLARRDVADLGAEQKVEERVGRRPRRRGPVGDEHRAHPGHRRGGGCHPRVVRLHASARDQRVGARLDRLRQQEPHLADFVAAEGERQRVVALDEEAAAIADRGGEPRHLLDRARGRPERRGGHVGEPLAGVQGIHRQIVYVAGAEGMSHGMRHGMGHEMGTDGRARSGAGRRGPRGRRARRGAGGPANPGLMR